MSFAFQMLERRRRTRGRWVAASVVAHVVVLVAAASLGRARAVHRDVEPRVPIVFFTAPRRPPAASAPPAVRHQPRAARRALAEPTRPVTPVVPEAPVAPAPSPHAEPQPLVTGLTLSSTTRGSVAAPAGNTLAATGATGGRDVSRGPAAVPGTAISQRPHFLNNVSADEVRGFYPAEARRAQLQAAVRVKLLIDTDGRVARATLLVDPGHGFGEAALRLARRYRFTPALVDGRPVATEIEFTIRFELE